jgi:nucleotide-binding universal stress UspA family protein
MTYRSLLVMLDHDPHCAARTRIAIDLAKRMGSHLVGLAPTGLVDLPTAPSLAAAVGEFVATAWEAARTDAERAAETFREACRAAALKSFEAVVDEADKADSVVRHAHCSDLTLISQADPAATDFRAAQELVEQVILYSARPSLVVPYIDPPGSLGSRALVAWDDSREAARAVSDALPLLRLAQRVQVIEWSAPGDTTKPRRHDALTQWLLWQGVIAESQHEVSDLSIADAMLSRAADLECDLLVMGAYGHARWAERVLGGATRGLLAGMTLPVLMSH